MPRAVLYFCLLFLGCCGTYLTFGNHSVPTAMLWYQAHLKAINEQLQGLKQCLQDYNMKYARYPSNDEGLAVLDTFAARFKITLHRQALEHWPQEFRAEYRQLYPLCDAPLARELWLHSKYGIHHYRKEHGRVPQNAAEFATILQVNSYGSLMKSNDIEVELGIGKANDVFLVCPAGVLCPWFIPYVYENRRNLAPELFAASPVNGDSRERFSVRIDQGVYVYSIGGKVFANRCDVAYRRYYAPRFWGGLLLCIALVLAAWQKKVSGILLLVVACLIGYAYGRQIEVHTTMGHLFHRREPEMVEQGNWAFRQYYTQGIINEETYQRYLAAMQLPHLFPQEAPVSTSSSRFPSKETIEERIK